MATDAELRLILRARDEASGALNKVQSGLAGVGRVAGDLQKKVFGGEFFKSILGGVGLGSGAQITQVLVDAITKPWKEAADYAKSIEDMSEKWLGHQKEMLAIRREILGITKEESVVDLERRAREAKSAFDAAYNAKVTGTYAANPYGLGPSNNVVTASAPDSQERADQLKRLQDQVIEANRALEQAKLKAKNDEKAALERENAEILANAKNASVAIRAQIEIEQKRDDQRRRINASVAADEGQRAAALVETEQLLTDFFSSVEKGAEILKEKKLDQAVETFFYSVDNPTPASGVRGGLEQTIAAIGPAAEQASRAVQTTLGGAVYAISDGIAGWATGILSTGQAASQIWTNFKMAALQAFTDMVAQYAVKKAAMFAIDVLFSAKGLALQAASAAKSLVAWIPSAIAASISSYGTAALIGAAAVAAVLAASGGFADGGIVRGPGTGTSDSILARLSNGEYVVPAAAVQRIGESNLDAMSYGGMSAATAMVPALSSGGGGRAATVLVDNRREADRFRRGSQMETQIVQVVQANRYRIAT